MEGLVTVVESRQRFHGFSQRERERERERERVLVNPGKRESAV
jgi:hypothetical protein